MVKQGDIIKINLNPKLGYEQQEYKLYVCLSHQLVMEYSNIGIFAPISNTEFLYPFYISLTDDTLQTTGKVLLDQIVAIELSTKEYTVVESCSNRLIQDLLSRVKVIFDKN